jgi:hypothetical protein
MIKWRMFSYKGKLVPVPVMKNALHIKDTASVGGEWLASCSEGRVPGI